MDGCRQREVVLELEQVRLVRRRAKTSLSFCRGCGKATDFIRLTNAAELFDVPAVEVFDFTRSNHCHFVVANEGEIYICLVALLEVMRKKLKTGNFKLLGAN
ncbi:MAG TPA: hypothetical protein VFZ23_11360 [Pyrinomonadaceae bacterium]